jgi:hypothetical protein
LGKERSVQLSHPELGQLVFDAEIGWWEGSVTLPSNAKFLLYVHTPAEGDSSITNAALVAFEKMKASELFARQFAAKELLAVYNKEWSEGKKIAEHEFVSRLVPAAIQLWPDGDAEMSFGDDDLFWGHEIGVRYRGGKFTEAVVQG